MAGLKDGDDYRDGERFKIPALLRLICLAAGGGGTLLSFILSFLMTVLSKLQIFGRRML